MSLAELSVVSVGATTYILVPNGEHLLAIDGETQLAAHHALGRSTTVAPTTRTEHRLFPLAAIVHHAVPTARARQYFHDLNLLAVRPNVSLGLAMDTQDPVMQIVSDVEAGVELLAGRVDKMARQLPKKTDKIVTLQTLRQMVIDIAKGISGVQFGARPAPMPEVDLEELTAVAIDWIGAFFETFRTEIIDRDTYLAGSGPALAAVGAIGHSLLKLDPLQRQVAQADLLHDLKTVDWTKSHHWLGIAGNFTASGVFSVKGTKEVAYAVYNALTDSDNGGYQQIRGQRPAAGPDPIVDPADAKFEPPW